MRWWLALAFAGIAALTALAVAEVFTARSESAIHKRARELAAGSAVTAAPEISRATSVADVRASAKALGESRGMALFVLSRDGKLLTPVRSRSISVTSLPNYAELRATSLGGSRVVDTVDGGRLVTVALPLRRSELAGALIAVARRPDLEAAIGIVQYEIIRAALWAVAIGAMVGLGVALLITRRIRRISKAAAEIAEGRFEQELGARFPDELGVLAGTIDSMRRHLRASFDGLEGERDRLNRLLEQLQEGVVAVDSSLIVEFANTRARHLVGVSVAPGEPLPEPWPTFSLRDAASSLFDAGATARMVHASSDSGRIYALGLLPPTRLSPAGVVVITDVTERQRRERAEREFVTNAAHELRTPLAAIASAVEVLQGGAKENVEDRDRFLAVVERQTTRLTGLAHALLTLARAQTRSEAIRLEPVLLAPVLEQIALDVDAPAVAVDVSPESAYALAHAELLRQALGNVTSNAVKHAGGSRITLRARAQSDGEEVRIDVMDEGPGMTQSQAERALDRFYRAAGSDGDGFGLGLSIVREAVEVMGGRLSIESRPHVGTTVTIVLQSASAESVPA